MQAVLKNPTITVIRPQGSLNAANALEFQQDLTKALAQNTSNRLLVDLEQVEALDSAGLMALVSALKFAQDLGRQFSLCWFPHLSELYLNLPNSIKFLTYFEAKVVF